MGEIEAKVSSGVCDDVVCVTVRSGDGDAGCEHIVLVSPFGKISGLYSVKGDGPEFTVEADSLRVAVEKALRLTHRWMVGCADKMSERADVIRHGADSTRAAADALLAEANASGLDRLINTEVGE